MKITKKQLRETVREVIKEEWKTYKGDTKIMPGISKIIESVYQARKKAEDDIKKYLNKTLKGKIVNVNPLFHKEVENAKVKDFNVEFYVDKMLTNNINYKVTMITDKGSFEMHDKTWDDDFEIVK